MQLKEGVSQEGRGRKAQARTLRLLGQGLWAGQGHGQSGGLDSLPRLRVDLRPELGGHLGGGKRCGPNQRIWLWGWRGKRSRAP